MALFTPSESPAVVVREIDLTGGVPNVQSTTGAMVGGFRWGPLGQRVLVSNEAELASTFGTPNNTITAVPFITATQFLKYTSSLYVVRQSHDYDSDEQALTAATNAFGAIRVSDDVAITGDELNDRYHVQVGNDEVFRNTQSTVLANVAASTFNIDSSGTTRLTDGLSDSGNVGQIMFMAKYPGEIGNSIKVSMMPADVTSTKFDAWTYAGSFNSRPDTSNFASGKGSSGDEVHIVVIDEDGLLSGTRGTVLETFPNLSILTDAKNDEGQSIYAREVVNARSNYIRMYNFTAALEDKGAAGASSLNTSYYAADSGDRDHKTLSLSNGTDTSTLNQASIQAGMDLYADKDQVEIDFLIVPGAITSADQISLTNYAVSIANARKDCIAVSSVARNDILDTSSDATRVSNAVTTANSFTKSSYLVVDNNYLKVYDKYNDRYVFIPSASTVAGIMAATDYNQAPWFSPAGSRRGQLLGVTALAYSPTKAQRDTLYKAGINPIANIPGQGVLLFGDKTFLGRPSAFDRINVRRLFLVLERAIGRAAEQVLFEFNDEFTRAEFVNIVEPVLREVQGRRGITDFRVVCDETNNTAAVIDRNEFIASIFIKPARSINYVTLNFVAVRTGVDFEEVVGTV